MRDARLQGLLICSSRCPMLPGCTRHSSTPANGHWASRNAGLKSGARACPKSCYCPASALWNAATGCSMTRCSRFTARLAASARPVSIWSLGRTGSLITGRRRPGRSNWSRPRRRNPEPAHLPQRHAKASDPIPLEDVFVRVVKHHVIMRAFAGRAICRPDT